MSNDETPREHPLLFMHALMSARLKRDPKDEPARLWFVAWDEMSAISDRLQDRDAPDWVWRACKAMLDLGLKLGFARELVHVSDAVIGQKTRFAGKAGGQKRSPKAEEIDARIVAAYEKKILENPEPPKADVYCAIDAAMPDVFKDMKKPARGKRIRDALKRRGTKRTR